MRGLFARRRSWLRSAPACGALLVCALALLVLLARAQQRSPAPALGPDCQQLQERYPSLVFCEDFEAPQLRDARRLAPGQPWYERYGGTSHGDCLAAAGVACPNGKPALMQVIDEQEGHVLAVHYEPCSRGGNVAYARLPRALRDIGFTVAVKWASDFLIPDGEPSRCGNEESFHTGIKYHRWFPPSEDATHHLSGLGTAAPGSCAYPESGPNVDPGAMFPFVAGFQIEPCGAPEQPCGGSRARARLGAGCRNDVEVEVLPDRSRYEWGRTARPGAWSCLQYHYQDWGSRAARIRYWVDGVLVADVTADMSDARAAQRGLSARRIENYYNGGYRGAATSHRYEDNWVVTEGEPVPCSAIGR
jgi:hypothetical protein